MRNGEYPRHSGWVDNHCRYCVCQVCNMMQCRWRTHWARCQFCRQRTVHNVIRPTLDCDFFTPVHPSHHVYRIVKVHRKRDRVGEILEMLRKMQGSDLG